MKKLLCFLGWLAALFTAPAHSQFVQDKTNTGKPASCFRPLFTIDKANNVIYSLGPDGSCHFQGDGGVWHEQGAVISPSLPQDQGYLVEPSVIYENNQFEMWFREGFDVGIGAVGYATSTDGAHWTRYSNGADVVQYGEIFFGPFVLKSSGTYYMFTTGIYLLTASSPQGPYSSSGLLLSNGSKGSWDDQEIANPYVFACPGGWCMVYAGYNSLTNTWQTGLATSSSLTSGWTKYSGNPIVASPPQASMKFVAQVGSLYWAWGHGGWTGGLPTDILRFSSPDLHTWTRTPADGFTLPRTTADEGVNTMLGQVADPNMVEIDGNANLCPTAPNNSCTYLFYDASPDGSQTSTNFSQIKLAIANTTIAGLTATNEGVAQGGVDTIAQEVSKTTSLQFTVGSGGVLINGLVAAASGGTVTAYSGIGPILGIAESTEASGQYVTVDLMGQSSCLPEGIINAGHLLIAGSTTATSCRDSSQTALSSISPSVSVVGTALASSNAAPLANPGAPTSITQSGTSGGTDVWYWCVAGNSLGTTLISSSPLETTTSNAILSSSNYNVVTCPAISLATSYTLLKNPYVSPASTTPTGVCDCLVATSSSNVIDDTSNGATAYTVPLINTTGAAVPVALLGSGTEGTESGR